MKFNTQDGNESNSYMTKDVFIQRRFRVLHSVLYDLKVIISYISKRRKHVLSASINSKYQGNAQFHSVLRLKSEAVLFLHDEENIFDSFKEHQKL